MSGAPENLESWNELRDLASELERPDEAAELMRKVLNGGLSSAVASELGQLAVDFHDEWFGDDELLIGILRRTLRLDPSAAWAFERLSLLLTTAARWNDLLAEYDQALEATEDNDARIDLLDEVARIAKDFAGETTRANDYLKQLVLLKPEDGAQASTLERRLEAESRHRDLIDVWEARLSILDEAEGLETLLKIGNRWLDPVGEPRAAVESAIIAIKRKGGEDGASAILEAASIHESADRETRGRALKVLKTRYTDSERGDDVVRILNLSLDVTDDASEQGEIHREAIGWLKESEQLADAVEHSAKLLTLFPTDESNHATLRELCEQTSSQERFSEALVSAAKACAEACDRTGLMLEAADVWRETIQEPRRAVELYSAVLADESTEEMRLTVARHLRSLLTEEDQQSQRLEVLVQLAALEAEDDATQLVLGEAARLADVLGNTDRALSLWAERLEANEADLEALDARVELLERHERWEQLIADLQKRSTQASDEPAKRRDMVQITEIYETRLGAVDRAIDTWNTIQEEFGPSAEGVDSLARLSASANRWTDVVDLLKRAVDDEPDQDRRLGHLAQLGDVFRERREGPANAIEYYQRALEVDPRHAEARAGLRALVEHPEAGPDAVENLATAYREADEWEETLELVAIRVTASADPAAARWILLEAATLLEQRADRAGDALQMLRRAFALSADSAIEVDLNRLGASTEEWNVVIEAYREAIAQCQDEPRIAELYFAQGKVFENKLMQAEAALDCFSQVCSRSPGDLAAVTSLITVAGAGGRWEDVTVAFVGCARALERIDSSTSETVETVTDAAEDWNSLTSALADTIARQSDLLANVAHDLKLGLALWHRDRRQDPDSAEIALKRAVSDVAEADTLRILAELQRANPGRPLVDTLLQLADVMDEDLASLHEASKVALTALEDAEAATPILRRCLKATAAAMSEEAAPDAPDATQLTAWTIDQLVTLALSQDDAQTAHGLLVDGAALPFPTEKTIALRFQAAQIANAHLGNAERAIELCRSVLEDNAEHGDTITLLGHLFDSTGQLDELLSLRTRELELEPPLEARLALRLEIARVMAALSHDAADQIAILEKNLHEHPAHTSSVDELCKLLEAQSETDRLFELLTEQAQVASEALGGTEAAGMWARAGRLAQEKLEDEDRAVDAYTHAVELAADIDTLDRLSAIWVSRERFGAAVGYLTQRLELTETNPSVFEDRRDVVARLGNALSAHGNNSLAIEYLTAALELDPAGNDVRALLAKLYKATEDWALLGPLLSGGVEFAEDSAQKIEFLVEAADVHSHRLNDLVAAVPLLERAVTLSPTDRKLRLALSDALRHSDRYDEARELLDTLLGEFGRRRTPERAAVHYHLARISQAQGDLLHAIEQLEAASSIVRGDLSVLRLLGEVSCEQGDLEKGERAYRALLLLVGRKQAVKSSVAGDEEAKVGASGVLFELHRIAIKQGADERARDLLESALEAARDDDVEAARLEEALLRAGHTDLLLKSLEQRLEKAKGPEAAAEVLARRASVLRELERPGDAIEAQLGALSRAPLLRGLLADSYQLCSELDEAEQFFGVATQLGSSDELSPSDACELWLQLGGIAQSSPEQTARAAEYFDYAGETGERPQDCFDALSPLVGGLGDNAMSLRCFSRYVSADDEVTDPVACNTALYELAGLELLDPATASEGAEHLEAALDREPLHDKAVEVLRTALDSNISEPAVVQLFERVARESGDPATLLVALGHSSTLEGASMDMVRDAVELARELKDGAQLQKLLGRLIELARQDEQLSDVLWAFGDLADMLESAGDAEGTATLLREAIQTAEAVDAFDMELRLARLLATELANPENAIAIYERLLAEDAGNIVIWKPLLGVYRSAGHKEKLESFMAELQEIVSDSDELQALRTERARDLASDPARLGEAEEVLREILAEDPDNAEACGLLCQLLENDGRIDELRDLLEQSLQSAKDRGEEETVATLALQIAKMLEPLTVVDAIGVLKESLTWTSRNRDVLEMLLRLYGGNDVPNDRAEAMEMLMAIEVGNAASALALQIADVRSGQGDEQGVERTLEEGFQANPSYAPLRDRLIAWYTTCEAWSPLAALLTSDAENRTDEREKIAQLRAAARVLHENLGETSEAAELLQRAREIAPDDRGLLTDLLDYYIATDNSLPALELTGIALQSEDLDDETRAQLLGIRARLTADTCGESLEGLSSAVADLDQAKGLGREGLDSMLVDLLDLLRTRAAEDGLVDDERKSLVRLAELLPSVGDADRAIHMLNIWIDDHPEDLGIAQTLGTLATEAGRHDAALTAYTVVTEHGDTKAKVTAVLRMADLYEQAGDPLAAKDALTRIGNEAPGATEIKERLRGMYEAAGAYADIAGLLVSDAKEAETEEERYSLLCDAGRMYLQLEDRVEDAFHLFQEALELLPGESKATICLSEAYLQVGQIQDAASLLDEAIRAKNKKRSPALAELQHAMAKVARGAGDTEALFAWLEAALMSDRQNGAVAAELAEAAMAREDMDLAVKALQAVTLLKTPGPMSKAEAYLRQGQIAQRRGDAKKATLLAKRSLAADGNYEEAKAFIAELG
ncbi:MAG: tetratricopeptide repeat protein [Polyangiaceae bacterium]|nr:tetratricopeptide repeat protein [Polyangiaceae bacterium]